MARQTNTPWRWAIVLLVLSGITVGGLRFVGADAILGPVPDASASASSTLTVEAPDAGSIAPVPTSENWRGRRVERENGTAPSTASAGAPATPVGTRFSAGDPAYTEPGETCETLAD